MECWFYVTHGLCVGTNGEKNEIDGIFWDELCKETDGFIPSVLLQSLFPGSLRWEWFLLMVPVLTGNHLNYPAR